MKFKIGDRIYFKCSYTSLKYEDYGTVIATVYDLGYEVEADSVYREFRDRSTSNVFFVEPLEGEYLELEQLHNSPLIKALS